MELEQISVESSEKKLYKNNLEEKEKNEMLRIYFENKAKLKDAIRQALVYVKGGCSYRPDSPEFRKLIIEQVFSVDFLKKIKNNSDLYGLWIGERGKLKNLIKEVMNEVFTDKEKKALIEDSSIYGIRDPEEDEEANEEAA